MATARAAAVVTAAAATVEAIERATIAAKRAI
jgi:hypothetical protein